MNTVCPSCQTTNRLPEERIEDQAKCGRCGHELFDGEVINATSATLDKILQDEQPVLIDFGHHGAAHAKVLRLSLKTLQKNAQGRSAA